MKILNVFHFVCEVSLHSRFLLAMTCTITVKHIHIWLLEVSCYCFSLPFKSHLHKNSYGTCTSSLSLKIYSFNEFHTGLTEMDLAPALYKSYAIFLTEMNVTNQLHIALAHLVSEIHSYLHQHVSFPTSLTIHTTGTILLLLLLLLYVPNDQALYPLIGCNVH